ncbi:MAG: B12-binding domain-containing radical SAM protein, partial [Candidatus Omnitrophica bacterium]|nr:B12-binding domain-containing radical SAM protein [Candidatus Omnitrophota bacterium]
MRILFVLQEIEDEQLGIMYLSGILKRHGHATGLIKADYEVIFRKLQDKVPTILAYSTLGYYFNYYLELNKRIKNRFKVFSIFGGPYPTSNPKIIENYGVDAVCVGEGEYPILELSDCLASGKSIENIRNLWVKKEGRVYKNSLRPLIDNLDQLPFPDRELFLLKSPFFIDRISMITSRGCHYSCPYCYNNIMRRIYNGKNIYRRRSVDNLIGEIRQAQEMQKVSFILFYDDIFILMPEWLSEFSDKYGKNINIPFSCYVRTNLVTPEIVSLLKKANCYSVSFGLEAGNDYLRNSVLNRGMSKQEIVLKATLFKDKGIKIRTTNIIGIPGGSIDADIETLRLNIKCQADFAKVSMFSIYPNTDFSVSMRKPRGSFAEHSGVLDHNILGILGKYSISASGHFQRMVRSHDHPLHGFRSLSEKKKIINLHRLFGIVV